MRGTLLSLFFFFISISCVSAQDKKTFKSQFLEAEYFFYQDDFDEARFIYSDLLNEDPLNANLDFLVGACYLSIPGEKSKALPFLEKAVESISAGYREGSYKEKNAPVECLFALARAYHITNQLDKAEIYYRKYHDIMKLTEPAEIDFVQKQIESCHLAEKMLKNPQPVTTTLFNTDVNASASNYNAVISKDYSMMIFMRQKPFYTAIMMTGLVKGKWKVPIVINDQLAVDDKCTVCSISADGKELYLALENDQVSDIYVSYFKKGKWTKAEKLNKNINTEYSETHASISGDSKTMYFTSDRPGGLGAMDIWVSNRDEKNDWGPAVNMGQPVNSIYSEDTPFITENGDILYFSSMGHATMGGFDVFYSSRLPNGSWSYPANLGYPISTCDDDLFYFPVGNGHQAIYSGFMNDAEGIERVNLVSLDTIPNFENIALKGAIKLEDNIQELDKSFTVTITGGAYKDSVVTIMPNQSTGEYSINLKPGTYELSTEGNGYTSSKENITVIDGISRNEIRMETSMTPVDVSSGEYLIIRNILFGFNEFLLNDTAKTEIEKLYRAMELHPQIFVQVTGHTDSKGNPDYNLKLSNKRAQSVVDYLVNKGISKERFISMGMGTQENIAVNKNPDGTDNPEGRRLNRYVEIKLINNSDQNIKIQPIEVPEHLKPKAELLYSVLLVQTKNETSIPANIVGAKINLTETDKARLFFTEDTHDRSKAVMMLNNALDNGFPDARIYTQSEKEDLILSLSDRKDESTGPYTIQIIALKKPVDLSHFGMPAGEVAELKGIDGYYRYVIGNFKDKDQAAKNLQDVYSNKFPDAFIIPLSRYYPKKSDNKSDTIRNSESYYTIQFSATHKPADKNKYKNLGAVHENLGSDGYYRYSAGMFISRNEAESELARIRTLGYPDAFIKKILNTK